MIRILGVGNPIMRDDGVGIAVVERLWQEPLPPGVEAVDAGTGGFDLIHLIAETERALLVDAVEMQARPGSLHWLQTAQVSRRGPPLHLSLHETRLGPILQWLELLGHHASISILGIQPACVEPGRGLTPAVEGAIPQAVEMIREWLAQECLRTQDDERSGQG